MSESVGFSWWVPSNGGSQQAFVQNYNGLVAAGFETNGFTNSTGGEMMAGSEDFDWVFVPYVFDPEFIEELGTKTHVHLQIGGYGRNDWEAARRAIEAADTISVLDPQLAEPFGVPDAPWIPNPPNFGMFEPTNPGEYVLIPKQVAGGGLGAFQEVVKYNDHEQFVVLGDSFPDPPENVTIKPKVPLSWMQQMYAGAKAVVNPVEREGLPNIAYEAFLTATPYVYRETGSIGSTQVVAEPPIDRIGLPCNEVFGGGNSPYKEPIPYNKYPDNEFEIGDHAVRDVSKASPEVGQRGREWVEEWAESGWDWGSKFEAIGELVESV